jgi:hypothetical protein
MGRADMSEERILVIRLTSTGYRLPCSTEGQVQRHGYDWGV